MTSIYLDHAATTPMREKVIEEIRPFLDNNFANPASVHLPGQEAAKAVEEAREKLAYLINAKNAEEIIFTSGGTESDNLAVKGTAMALKNRGKHIITSKIEHHAVLDSCKFLEDHLGFKVSYLEVDSRGFIDPEHLIEVIQDDTILISLMTANNETGTIQDINILSRIAAEHDILFHTDAVQAAGQIEIDVQDMDIDLLSLSAHKFNGPKGVGILYVKKGVKLIPQLSGGSQERNRRAGTVNVPGVIGMGKAAELAKDELKIKKENLLYLREYFLDRIFAEFDDIRLNGAKDENRLPGNINISFRNLDGQSILFNLSLNNIAASTGSACASGSISNSHVLKAINLDKDYIDGAIRFSLGYGNTKEEINQVMEVLPGIIKRLKELNQ
jgi:cysteine desulfurase